MEVRILDLFWEKNVAAKIHEAELWIGEKGAGGKSGIKFLQEHRGYDPYFLSGQGHTELAVLDFGRTLLPGKGRNQLEEKEAAGKGVPEVLFPPTSS